MFDNKYQAILADTEESRKIHYNLRYQVYCLEKGFESAGKFEDQLEKDEYDDKSVHFLIKEQKSGRWLGTARLVMAEPDELPLREFTKIKDSNMRSDDDKVAEFSRLSILSNYRQTGKSKFNVGRSEEPEILLGLIRAARAYCLKEADIRNWHFLCRRSIKRILSRVGINMSVIGPPCQHRGTRFPFLMKLDSDYKEIPNVSPKTHEMFSQKQTYYRYSELYGYGYAEAA